MTFDESAAYSTGNGHICFLADAALISYEMTAVFLLEKLSVNVHP